MDNKLEVQKFNSALEEIKSILVEAEFASRWILIEAHHKVGQIILELPGETATIVQNLAVKLDRSERGLWYAVKFAKTFKTVDEIPEGKNVSMNNIIKKYLTSSKELSEHVHTPVEICSVCHARLDK